MRLTIVFAAILAFGLGASAGGAAQSTAAASLVAAALDAAAAKDWARARDFAAQSGDPVAGELVEWRRLLKAEAGWGAYRDFVAAHRDWPGLDIIRARGERQAPPGTPLAEIDAFVGAAGMQTGAGALRRAEALAAGGRDAEAQALIVRAWREFSLRPGEFDALRGRFGRWLAGHHEARADMLLWRGLTGEAEAMKPLVGDGWERLIAARVRLRRLAPGVDAAIAAVPGALKDDPGLAYERFRWRMRKGRHDDAEALLAARTGEPASLGRPEAWADRRRRLARRALRGGRAVDAYNLANLNHLSEGADFADLEWLAGWIALSRMNDPARARAHFARFLGVVETPISLGRGWYWTGRAHEAAGDRGAASAAYRQAAIHSTSFYGQLAAERAGLAADPALLGGETVDWRSAPVSRRSVARAAVLLNAAGQRRRAHWFLTHIASHYEGRTDIAGIADLAREIGRPDAAIRVAKIAARKGLILPDHYYPVTELAGYAKGVEPALALAVARQESELNPQAVSPAGARGLMQLMPATARSVSRKIGLKYAPTRLTDDWRYNAALGQSYLAGRLAEFGGSVAMAAGAYNAGPHRIRRWIARYGDPRAPGVDPIDWIETIPFRETRNYVQRVLEGLQVYRARLSGRPAPSRLAEDMTGR